MTGMDMSDAATGLPPLDEPVEEDTLWAMVLHSGQADVLSPIDGSPQGCFVLSVRGLVNDPEGRPEWGQMHLAIPHDAVPSLARRIEEYYAQTR